MEMQSGRRKKSYEHFDEVEKMLIYFDESASVALKEILLSAPDLFAEASPEFADVILLESDELAYVRATPWVRRFPAKCLCISETDIPTFALPGLYAANIASFLFAGRSG